MKVVRGGNAIQMVLEFRPARASDIDALVAIENAIFGTDRISRRSFRRLIRRETAETLVAANGRELCGYVLVLYRKGSAVARLYSLGVVPACAGAGLGRKLLNAAEQTAFRRGRLVLRLEVREDNARAIRLYEENGYRRIGRENGYYEDGAAALCLEKPLRGDARFGRPDARGAGKLGERKTK